MGIIRELFSSSESADQREPLDEKSKYEALRDEVTAAYPVIVHQKEIDSFKNLIQRLQEIPDPAEKSVVDWDSFPVDIQGEIEDSRENAEKVVKTWDRQVEGDSGVVFCQAYLNIHLYGVLTRAKSRDELEMDEFQLTQGVDDVERLVRKTDVVHSDPATSEVLVEYERLPPNAN